MKIISTAYQYTNYSDNISLITFSYISSID